MIAVERRAVRGERELDERVAHKIFYRTLVHAAGVDRGRSTVADGVAGGGHACIKVVQAVDGLVRPLRAPERPRR